MSYRRFPRSGQSCFPSTCSSPCRQGCIILRYGISLVGNHLAAKVRNAVAAEPLFSISCICFLPLFFLQSSSLFQNTPLACPPRAKPPRPDSSTCSSPLPQPHRYSTSNVFCVCVHVCVYISCCTRFCVFCVCFCVRAPPAAFCPSFLALCECLPLFLHPCQCLSSGLAPACASGHGQLL